MHPHPVLLPASCERNAVAMRQLSYGIYFHFLKDENICRKIVDALQQHSFHSLLEVGPGGGALTKYLLKIENIDFKAVELDREKVDFLIHTYPEIKNKIIHKNFLEIQKPFENRFTVVGNFPYNISSQILF